MADQLRNEIVETMGGDPDMPEGEGVKIHKSKRE
jgi:hypothetical protein